jgi:hypothetical protein
VILSAAFADDLHWPSTLLLLGGGALAVAVLAGLAGWRFGRATRSPAPAAPAPRHEPAAPGPAPRRPPTDGGDATLAAQRAALAQGCVTVRSQLDHDVLADILDKTLSDAGVEAFDPLGDRLDTSAHHVVGIVAAQEQWQQGTIARTYLPGYRDGGRVLRPADVAVYRWQPPPAQRR